MKINELGLKLNKDNLHFDLIFEFLKVMEKLAMELEDLMKSKAKLPVVSHSIKHFTESSYKKIEIVVGSDHWQAFLDNYGTGSKMANNTQNPGLSAYKHSDFWHDYRPTNAITKRKTGSYEIPDWEEGYGYLIRHTSDKTGIRAGTNMETLHFKEFGTKVRPKAPSFFVQNSIRLMEKRFVEDITEVYKKFKFSKYLKGGG